jgi:hypothetical protein
MAREIADVRGGLLMADIVAKVASGRLVRNNRLQEARRANQSCATACFIESMLPVGTPKNRFAAVSAHLGRTGSSCVCLLFGVDRTYRRRTWVIPV